MFRITIFLATALFVTGLNAETIELGYRLRMGTYTIPVTIPDLGRQDLTFDTGASLTVLSIAYVEQMELPPQGRAGVTFPHQGVRVEAYFYTLPVMYIGNCIIRNSRIIGIDLPEGRPGALGMADLEKLSPFTFKNNGQLEFTCKNK